MRLPLIALCICGMAACGHTPPAASENASHPSTQGGAAGTTTSGPASANVAGTTTSGPVTDANGHIGTPGDVDPGPGTDTDKATLRCAALQSPPDETLAAPAPTFPASTQGWLYTRGNHIYNADGTLFHGRGANLADTRGCGACACNSITLAQSTAEVIRRIDALVDDWHANFIRLDLESYSRIAGNVIDDPAYLVSLEQIVAHVQTKKGVYLEMSVWFDPSLDANGWPTATTDAILQTLVHAFGNVPQVMFGLSNEPKSNTDGALDADVWTRMNSAATTIRDAEKTYNVPAHIIVAQGTGGWARFLSYYETHPLTAGNGNNFAYETHPYDVTSTFSDRFITPSKSIPVIIGEFGPIGGTMSLADTAALMAQAEAADVPYMAWTFHGRCVPSLLVDNSGGGCGIGMTLTPSDWGAQLKARLAAPW